MESEPILLDKDEEMVDPSTPEKRKRGRPPTTGDYYVKQEADHLARERDEADRVKMVLDPAVPFEDKSGRIAKLAKEVEEELAEAPEDDIFSRMLQGANAILKVARLSGKHQGQYRGLLNRIAAEIRAASCALNKRLARERNSSDEELRKEMASLKRELGKQRKAMEALRAETETLRKERAELLVRNIASATHAVPRITRIEEVRLDLGSVRNKVGGTGKRKPAPKPAGREATGNGEGMDLEMDEAVSNILPPPLLGGDESCDLSPPAWWMKLLAWESTSSRRGWRRNWPA